jgi:hypothetical protein
VVPAIKLSAQPPGNLTLIRPQKIGYQLSTKLLTLNAGGPQQLTVGRFQPPDPLGNHRVDTRR